MKTTNEELFRSITVEMDSLYKQKNADYGNSYAELYARYGSIYPLIRLEEKIARVERLTTSEKDRLREGVFGKQYTEDKR